MSKVFLIGSAPPQFTPNKKIEAANYRTWQFLQPLLEEGHKICLCFNFLDLAGNSEALVPVSWMQQLVWQAIPFRQMGWPKDLRHAYQTFEPDCILAVNFDSCVYATKLQTEKPIWMDIYGDYLTIIQAARYRAQNNRGLLTSIDFVNRVLKRGDVFSVCNTPQQHALVGELAMAGRLNYRSFGYDFVKLVLPGAPGNQEFAINEQGNNKKDPNILASLGLSQEDFIVLWCGGYNTWTDIKTLYLGLEWAMKNNPQIHYLSIGANTYDAPDNIYIQLLDKIQESPYRDRFHMLGWRPWEEIPKYYQISDTGLNIDALHYETIYGTRTRILEMAAAGLAIIISLGTELSYLLKMRDAALTFGVGDWQALGEQILSLSNDPIQRNNLRKKAFDITNTELSFRITTAPIQEWIKMPQQAPDNFALTLSEKLLKVEYKARAGIRKTLWDLFGLER